MKCLLRQTIDFLLGILLDSLSTKPKALSSISSISSISSMAKKKLSITLSEKLIKEIDEKRGLIPRSAYLEHVLKNIKLKKLLVILPFILLFLLSSQNINAINTTTIQPDPVNGTDTYLREDNPSTNYGNSTNLYVGLTASGDKMRDIFKFNLSSIPSGSTIISADFKLYMFYASSSTTLTINAYRVNESWNEGVGDAASNSATINGTTWDARWYLLNWTNLGGYYNGTVEDSANLLGTVGWYTWNIRSLAQEWLDGNYSNYGIILKSNETLNEFKGFYSSDYTTDPSLRPKLVVNYSANAPPTIESISDNSNATNPTTVGGNVVFNVSWSDLDSIQAKLYVCNSTDINYSGCADKEFCSSSYSSSNNLSCQYTAQESDSMMEFYWIKVCDNEGECSSISSKYNFSVNHKPVIKIIDPNGGETINQSLGNYTIRFNVSDSDNHTLNISIYYSTSPGNKTNLIVEDLAPGHCIDIDNSTITANNCSYSWNSSGIVGTYWLDIEVNDTFIVNLNSSNSSFSVESLIDPNPPNVTFVSITSNLTSGKTVVVRANITDPYLRDVWLELNDTYNQRTNYTMSLESGDIYNVIFEAGRIGNYNYKIYADDLNSNIGNTTWLTFIVSKPNASTQSEESPSSALPLHVIKISGKLNATDVLKEINATLNIYSGFVFLSDYSQTQEMNNFSANETKTVSWFLSTPKIESNYTINITYKDKYNNTWQSGNFYVDVTDTFGASGTFVDINSYVEIEAGNSYTAEILVRDGNGNFVDASDVRLTLKDPLDNFVVQDVSYSSHPAVGHYNYTYSTSSGQIEGHWLLIANVTYGGNYYIDKQYWRLTGGPFDVRDIVIDDSTVPNLQISVTLENTGGSGKDMTVVWNLTRTDTGALLDSGSDTVLVNAQSTRNYAVNPTTTYVGNVKITFLGYYSGTEKAGAFESFTTSTEEAAPPSVPSVGVGAGAGALGGGVVAPVIVEEVISMQIELVSIPDEIILFEGDSKTVELFIKNLESELKNVALSIRGLPLDWYEITPAVIPSMEKDETKSFKINFKLPSVAVAGKYPFYYSIKVENTIIKEILSKITILSESEMLFRELESLNKSIVELKYAVIEIEEQGIDVSSSIILIKLIDEKISEIELLIYKREFDKAKERIKVARSYIEDAEKEFRILLGPVERPALFMVLRYLTWVTASIFIAAAVLLVLYISKTVIKRKRTSVSEPERKLLVRSPFSQEDEVQKRIKGLRKKLENG